MRATPAPSAPPPGGVKVLVVEDESTIAANLHEYLTLRGFDVDLACDGAAALALIATERFDAIVLDLGLPRADGFEVLDMLRRRLLRETPVLILTARDALDARLRGLEAGADDYLTKPFALAEVAARLQALHRRATGAVVPRETVLGKLRFDRRARQVFVDQRPLHLMPRSMQILERLLREPGAIVPRRELERLLWPNDDAPPDALRGQIYLLRRALVDAGFDGLETVHGIGLRLRA